MKGNERVGGLKPDNGVPFQRFFFFFWSSGLPDDKERNSHAAKVYQRSFRFSVLLEVLRFRVAEIN